MITNPLLKHTLTLKKLLLTLSKHAVPILDVRSIELYHQNHVSYAKNIPFSELVQRRMFELPPRHKPFIVFCDALQMSEVMKFFATRATPWCIVAFVCTTTLSQPTLPTLSSSSEIEANTILRQYTNFSSYSPTILHSLECTTHRRQCDLTNLSFDETNNMINMIDSIPTPEYYVDNITDANTIDYIAHPAHGKRFKRQIKEINVETTTATETETETSNPSNDDRFTSLTETQITTDSITTPRQDTPEEMLELLHASKELGHILTALDMIPVDMNTIDLQEVFDINTDVECMTPEKHFTDIKQYNMNTTPQPNQEVIGSFWDFLSNWFPIGFSSRNDGNNTNITSVTNDASQQHILLFDPCPGLDIVISTVENHLLRREDEKLNLSTTIVKSLENDDNDDNNNAFSIEKSPITPYWMASLQKSYHKPLTDHHNKVDISSQDIETISKSNTINLYSPIRSYFSSLPFYLSRLLQISNTNLTQNNTHHASTNSTSINSVSPIIRHFTALDIGCGHGRDSLWLSLRPFMSLPSFQNTEYVWHVTAVDEVQAMLQAIQSTTEMYKITDRLTVGRSSVKANGSIVHKPLTLSSTSSTSSTENTPTTSNLLPKWDTKTFDLVLIVRFLNQELLLELYKYVSLGGFIFYSHFYHGCEHPKKVLEPQQLENIFKKYGFEVIYDQIEILGDGRPVQNFLAKKITQLSHEEIDAIKLEEAQEKKEKYNLKEFNYKN